MAQGAHLYRGTIELADSDRNHYAHLTPSTILHPSESKERLALRLLAYALLHAEGLTFRPGGVSEGEAPELARQDDSGRLSHWIEVGTPAAARLQQAARRARVSVVTHEGLLRRWRSQHRGRLPSFEGEILVLEAPLVTTLAETLPRRFHWQATISGGTLYLDADGEALSSTLQLLSN